jgi:hypothetical protein
MPGPHDFTVREDASRLLTLHVHRGPHSTYRDDAYAPLHEAGCRDKIMISEKEKVIYFPPTVFTSRDALIALANFAVWRQRFRSRSQALRGCRSCRIAHRFARRAGSERSSRAESSRHARACPGHPRLGRMYCATWMAGTSPGHDGG